MLRITIELVPKGNEAMKKTLGAMTIANDGTGSAQTGNYKVRLMSVTGSQRSFEVAAVDRQQSIFGFLADVFRKRNERVQEIGIGDPI